MHQFIIMAKDENSETEKTVNYKRLEVKNKNDSEEEEGKVL